MKKVLTNYRYYLLALLAVLTILGIFSEPAEELPMLTWLWALFTSKAVGFGAGYVYYRLYTRWEKRNSIPELVKFNDEF